MMFFGWIVALFTLPAMLAPFATDAALAAKIRNGSDQLCPWSRHRLPGGGCGA
jgi:hypothetical protein